MYKILAILLNAQTLSCQKKYLQVIGSSVYLLQLVVLLTHWPLELWLQFLMFTVILKDIFMIDFIVFLLKLLWTSAMISLH